VHQIDMKFERQLRPATETSWVVRKTIEFSWNVAHSSRFWTGWTSRD